MNHCLAESDFRELGEGMLSGFDRRVASIPDFLCAPFHQEARQLETELLSIYRFVVLSVRKEEDLAHIAACWALMVKICDDSATRLGRLSSIHPHCRAEVYYDRVLDLRNKCQRLQNLHS
jgi:hypothetical protein